MQCVYACVWVRVSDTCENLMRSVYIERNRAQAIWSASRGAGLDIKIAGEHWCMDAQSYVICVEIVQCRSEPIPAIVAFGQNDPSTISAQVHIQRNSLLVCDFVRWWL